MLTRQEILQIAAKALADPRTVERWARGEPIRGMALERVERAAKELRIKRPATDAKANSL